MKVRAPLASLSARRKHPAGLTLRRTKFGQLIQQLANPKQPDSALQLATRQDLADASALYRQGQSAAVGRPRWDALNRWRGPGRTGLNTFVHWYAPIFHNVPVPLVWTDYTITPLPGGNWRYTAQIGVGPLFAFVRFGTDPRSFRSVAQLIQTPFGWTFTSTDDWSGLRVYCWSSACAAGNQLLGVSGLIYLKIP